MFVIETRTENGWEPNRWQFATEDDATEFMAHLLTLTHAYGGIDLRVTSKTGD